MAKEGIPFILLFLIPAIVLGALGLMVGAVLSALLAVFMAFFFRDPDRRSPAGDDLIVSPADGRVVQIAKLDPKDTASATQISIFLSPLDVHINRSPIAGEIVDAVYKPGSFHIASRDIASVENEQNVVTVKGARLTVVFRQIAGTLARRVVFSKKRGDHVSAGERVGLMKFSSRMDVLVPGEAEILIAKGQRVIGGITILARVRPSTEV